MTRRAFWIPPELELISAEDHRELESLGGRALFYVCKLAASLEPRQSARTFRDENGEPFGSPLESGRRPQLRTDNSPDPARRS